MHGHFSIIGGHMPELPPKVYAYDSICVPYESHKGLSFLSHMDAICIPSMSWNLSPIIMCPMWILHMSHTTPKGVKFLSYMWSMWAFIFCPGFCMSCMWTCRQAYRPGVYVSWPVV